MSRRGLMPARRLVFLATILAGVLTGPLLGHRLDEYLQTTFITVEPNQVDLDLTLTPGINLAAGLFATLDRDQDGTVSTREADTYAREVGAALSLEVDDTPRSLTVLQHHFPSREDLLTGRALLRIRFRAEFPPLAPGDHHLTFRNSYQTNVSVYLVNAVLPESKSVEITRQTRDLQQLQSRIDFRLAAAP